MVTSVNNMPFKNDGSKQIKSFSQMANDYTFWEWTANALLVSAGVLKREGERALHSHKGASFPRVVSPEELTKEVEWMLQAFAIECLLKGLFVKGGHKIVKNGEYKGVPNVGDHDLVNLAKNVIGNMSKKHNDALRKLGLIGKSIGRYPIAKKSGDLKFSEEENDVGYDDSVLITNKEQSLIDTFTSELLRKLEKTETLLLEPTCF